MRRTEIYEQANSYPLYLWRHLTAHTRTIQFVAADADIRRLIFLWKLRARFVYFVSLLCWQKTVRNFILNQSTKKCSHHPFHTRTGRHTRRASCHNWKPTVSVSGATKCSPLCAPAWRRAAVTDGRRIWSSARTICCSHGMPTSARCCAWTGGRRSLANRTVAALAIRWVFGSLLWNITSTRCCLWMFAPFSVVCEFAWAPIWWHSCSQYILNTLKRWMSMRIRRLELGVDPGTFVTTACVFSNDWVDALSCELNGFGSNVIAI